jgi:uncharacterized protein YndB with AHSA1/START domain
MPVTDVRKDPAAPSLTITAEFSASAERVWQLWEDPRQLERWWGPPMFPATFEELDLRDGGHASYFMTGPNGETPRGWWRIIAAEPPRRIELEDGFADEHGTPLADMPVMTMRVSIVPADGAITRMEVRTTFPTPEAMERVLAMGLEEGMNLALGQIDAIVAA